MEGQRVSISLDRVAPTPPGVQIALPAMPNVVQTGGLLTIEEGLDLMDITTGDNILGQGPTPFLTSTEGNDTALTGLNQDSIRNGETRLADLPVEIALSSAGLTGSPPRVQGDPSSSQTTRSQRTFSRYKVKAVYELIVAFDPLKGYKVSWYHCGAEEAR